MATEVQTGGEPPLVNLSDEPDPTKARAKPPARSRIPVAKPAPAKAAPKLRDAPEEAKADLVEDLLSPTSVRSLAASIAAHSLLILMLAFWYFSPVVGQTRTIDTRLAGSEFGDPSGDQLKGGLGMDTPLAMPESPNAPALQEVSPTFTSIPVAEIAAPSPQQRAVPKNAAAAANGGGVNLTNPGGAGNGDGFGVAKFGHGGENINGVDVKVGDPQFTLIWDTRADIDLHVVEPGGSEIYWENRNGGQGGELDVDDVDGFGPENVNYVQGKGPPGTYKWFVHYYGGLGGMAQNTRWKVRVKHAGKIETYQGKFSAIGQKSQIFQLKMERDGGKSELAKPEEAREMPAGARVEAARPARALGPAPVSGPVAFAPAGVGFSATMPSDPKTGRKDFETPLGAVVGQTYTAEASEGGVAVVTLDFPAATLAKADTSKLLDDMVVKAIVEPKGTATGATKIVLAGFAGREGEFTVPDRIVSGGGVGRTRVYLAANRMYMLTAIGTKGFLNSPDVTDFFKTFAITDGK